MGKGLFGRKKRSGRDNRDDLDLDTMFEELELDLPNC